MLRWKWMYAVLCLGLAHAAVYAAPAAESAAKPGSLRTTNMNAGSSKFGASRNSVSFQSRLERAVGLTADQKDAVRGLLAQQRQDLQALRDEMEPRFSAIQDQTDTKIRLLLNADQQKKFDSFVTKQKQMKKSRKTRKAA